MTRAKKEKWPVHKQGKRCGYEEFEDGSIQIAPTYSDSFDETADSKEAIDELLAALTRHCYALLQPIAKTQRHFWEQVADDYELDLEKYDYTYNRATKRLIRRDKPEE